MGYCMHHNSTETELSERAGVRKVAAAGQRTHYWDNRTMRYSQRWALP